MGLEQHVFHVKIELESGMHIGAGDSAIEIGGVDNKVIRDALSNEPFIPGSSLKGKMRHLLEEHYAEDEEKLNLVRMLFGYDGNKKELSEEKVKPFKTTRLQFVDLFLTEDAKERLDKALGEKVYTSIKYENKIDRKTGTAEHPRPNERVPKGAVFAGVVIMNVFDHWGDAKEEFTRMLEKGFELLDKSYLGGSGSRGYGKVKTRVEPATA